LALGVAFRLRVAALALGVAFRLRVAALALGGAIRLRVAALALGVAIRLRVAALALGVAMSSRMLSRWRLLNDHAGRNAMRHFGLAPPDAEPDVVLAKPETVETSDGSNDVGPAFRVNKRSKEDFLCTASLCTSSSMGTCT
jgi:hypothetical protein